MCHLPEKTFLLQLKLFPVPGEVVFISSWKNTQCYKTWGQVTPDHAEVLRLENLLECYSLIQTAGEKP